MEIKNGSGFNKKPNPKPSCLKCGHFVICAVYKAIKPLMGNWTEEDSPFLAEEIAGICKKYAEQFISIQKAEEVEA